MTEIAPQKTDTLPSSSLALHPSDSLPSRLSPPSPLSPHAPAFYPADTHFSTRFPFSAQPSPSPSTGYPNNANTSSGLQASHGSPSPIPSARIVTYNINSLGQDAASNRSSRVRTNLLFLSSHTDVLFVQETRERIDSDDPKLHPNIPLIPGFTAFPNPNLSVPNSGGTCIYARNSFLANFQCREGMHQVVAEGYIHTLSLLPRKGPSPPLLLINVYLPCGNSTEAQTKRASCLSALTNSRPGGGPRHVIAAGDWNLTQHLSDSSGGDHFASSPKQRKLLQDTLDHFNLKEVYQADHTCFRASGTHTSSRLDRFYTSYSIADKALLSPRVSFPPHPHLTGSKEQVSDHMPLLLSWKNPKLDKKIRFSIPQWMASHPLFLDAVRTKIAQTRLPSHPVKRWLALKRIVRQTAMGLMTSFRAEAGTRAKELTLGISVYRSMKASPADWAHAASLANQVPELAAALQDDIKDRLRPDASPSTSFLSLPKVEAFVAAKFTADPLLDPTTSQKPNLLRKLGNSLPSSKSSVSHLHLASGESVWDTKSIAAELKATWGPVWSRPSPDKPTRAAYLSKYTKHINKEIPKISLDLVVKVMSKSRASSTGPDGIPFSIYTDLVDIFAKPLFLLTVHLSLGQKANKCFNNLNLHFFPKDTSLLPDRHRPISVSNTDNRLVANILRSCISPAILDILSPNQRAFTPGSSTYDNVAFFNAHFYANLARQDDYHLFMHDFSMAYDSVSRDFLFEMLDRVGIPSWATAILKALYTDVLAFPILQEAHKTVIPMVQGLKQGCPLSPLLFLLSIDPLVSEIAAIRGVDSLVFCDDVCGGSSDLSALAAMALPIEHFNVASGCITNMKKLWLVSTRPVTPAELQAAFPPPWSHFIQIREEAPHLGVLVGRDVTVADIFGPAVAKLQHKVAQCLSLKLHYSIQHRVIIANVFFLPILSYLSSFFLLDSSSVAKVRSCLSLWLANGKRFSYEHLTSPTSSAGIQQPLRSIINANLAAILCRKTAAQLDHRDDSKLSPSSLLMSDHVSLASRKYSSCVDFPVAPDMRQDGLYKLLHAHDPVPLKALASKLNPADHERKIGKDQALILARAIISRTKELPASLPPAIRFHSFELIHNAVPTRMRMRFASESDIMCSFCAAEPETLAHLHTACPTSRKAALLILNHSPDRAAATILQIAAAEDFTFRSAISAPDRVTLLFFSLAVWRTRRRFCSKEIRESQVASSISDTYFNLRASLSAKHATRDRTKERMDFLAMVSALSPLAIRAFTDGSSYGNPGPAGYGLYVFHASDPTFPPIHHSVQLGHASNNEAELRGLLFALDTIIGICQSAALPRPLPHVQIFIDSTYALDSALGKTHPKLHQSTIRAIHDSLSALRLITPTNLFWVPGHAKIPEQEITDLLAKRGAKGSTSSTPPTALEIAAHAAPEAHRPPPRPGAERKLSLSLSSQAQQPGPPARRSARHLSRANRLSFNGVDYSLR